MYKLQKLASKHRDWIQVVRAYGGADYSEDLVQDMYLRLASKPQYLEKAVEDGEVRDGYVFFILRSMLINKQNKDARNPIETVLETFHYLEDETEELDNKKALEEIYDAIDELAESWRWYDRKLFQTYKDTALSIRGIAKKTDISYISIFYTLKKCKERVREELGDMYEQYKKGNYERII